MRRREAERHRKALNKNVRNEKRIKYSETSSHHVVAWSDERAVMARSILMQFGIDIDSADNGVVLPTGVKNTPHKKMPDAYAHATIHTKIYYANITTLLNDASQLYNATKEDIIDTLQGIALDLQKGTFPLYKRIIGR